CLFLLLTVTMGFRPISSDLKYTSLRMYEMGWFEHDILDILQVSRRSLYRWRAIFRSHGSVTNPPPQSKGPERKITRLILENILHLFRDHPGTFPDELQWWLLYHHNIELSRQAISENLIAAGIS
ncbi:hypothetical protein DL96DRAFT_1425986, partial [Flagelloscypha sp. PMI_526]